ncbi:LacI family DNA-binding transcriptional regulator [Streptomyces sp. NPDC047071]|uniref:LacI family DNA-binding transcriptional regulator n=1 Tax=Streptomyces sp. NPDC047071 TaxID=3154808 RepID=UPI003455B42A
MLRPRPVRVRDVVDTAGAHPATASRALNPATRARVGAATARRVLRAAEDLGHRPDPIARSLKTARSHTVGLVVPDLPHPCFPPLVRGIESVLEPAGHHAWIVDTPHDPRRERAQVDSLRSRQADGLVVATAPREHPRPRALHAVRDLGLAEAARMLLDCVAGPPVPPPSRDRRRPRPHAPLGSPFGLTSEVRTASSASPQWARTLP